MTIAQEHNFSFSPPDSSPDSNHGSMLFDDDSKDGLFFDDEKPKKSNGRKGPGPIAADKRATHNAIERARRESLNGRFMTLAEALPSMANVKRPSKSIIVNRALEYVYDSQVKEHALIKENNELRREVDQLRARLGMAPLPPPEPLLAPKPSTKSSHVATYHKSFASAEGFGDEMAHAMGAAPSGLDSNSSPGSQDHQPSTAPTTPTSAVDASSPTLAFPTQMFVSTPATTVDSHSPSDSGSDAGFSFVQQQQQQQQQQLQQHQATLNPAQLSTSPFMAAPQHAGNLGQLNAAQAALLQAQFGYMSPNLLAPQHSAILALHLQQQQALQQQQNQHQHQFQDMYSMANVNAGTMGGWGGYNPAMETYSFMS